jgi:two-component system, NtrC family, sensor kinase
MSVPVLGTLLTTLFWLPAFLVQSQTLVSENPSQNPRLENPSQEGVILTKGWKWQAGDDPAWADSDFDDSAWETIDLTRNLGQLPQVTEAEIGWFRLHLNVDSAMVNKPYIVEVTVVGAVEIYLNDELVRVMGKVSKDPKNEEALYTYYNPFFCIFPRTDSNTIAVRYSLTKSNLYLSRQVPLVMFLTKLDGFVDEGTWDIHQNDIMYLTLVGLLLMMLIVHACYYYYNPAQRANLYFSLSLSLLIVYFIGLDLNGNVPLPVTWIAIINLIATFLWTPFGVLILAAVYSYLKRPRDVVFWLLAGLVPVGVVSTWIMRTEAEWRINFGYLSVMVIFLNYLYVSWKAIRAGNRNAHFLFWGGVLFFITSGIYVINTDLHNKWIWHWYINFSLQTTRALCIPFAVSLALARDFAQTSRLLQIRLDEVQQLSREKQQILGTQNERLEAQVRARTAELSQTMDTLRETQLEQLRQLQENIRQKDQLIAILEDAESTYLAGMSTDVRMRLLTNLRHSVLLTDEGWDNFVMLFERVNAGFFDRLRRKYPDLTPAEVRYMALSRLSYSGREMANMLGVSEGAIRQYRSRIRRKLDLPDTEEVEKIASVV